MSTNELIKNYENIVKKYENIIDTLLPEEFPISYLVEKTGKTRQGIRANLYMNFDEEKDFHKKGHLIYVSRETTFQLLSKGGIR